MTDAEKKWRDWDNEFTELEGILPAQCYRHSREAYKESLRSAIEKYYNNLTSGRNPANEYEQGLVDAYETVLEEMDSVTPKE